MGGLIVYFLFPFDYLMEWSYHLELVVMFNTIYFIGSGFLFSGLSMFLFQRPTPLDATLQLLLSMCIA
jgi:hypothetical protein